MPIDIRMPDGTIITNVPDNVTPDQLRVLGEAYAATTTTPAPATPSVSPSEVETERAAIESGRTTYMRQIEEAKAARDVAEKEVASRVGPRSYGIFGNLSQYQGVTARYDAVIATAERKLADLQKREQFLAERGRPAAQLSAMQQVGDLLTGIPRGAIRGTADIASTAGILGEGGEQFGRSVEAGGEALISGLGLEQSERTKEALQFDSTARGVSSFGEGLGSVVPFVGTSILGGTLKAVAIASKLDKTAKAIGVGTTATQAALGSGMGAAEARDRMDAWEKETGEKLNPVSRRLITAGGGFIGLLETVTINTLLNKAPGPIKASIQRRLDSVIKSAADKSALVEGVKRVTKEAVDQIESTVAGRMFMRGFVPEATQESASQILQNTLQRAAYDETQTIMEGVPESALLGGLVGGTVRGGTEAFSAAARKLNSVNTAVGEELEAARDETEAPVTFNIRVRDLKDPSRQIIEPVEILNMDGDMVSYRRPDGRLGRMSLDDLESRIVGESGYSTFATPEDYSASNLRTRLDAVVSGVEGADAGRLDRYISGVTSKISNALAFGDPQTALNYISNLESRFSGTRGKKAKTTSSPGDLAMQAVLKEARSIVTDYQVAYGKSKAQSGVEVGAPTTTEESAQIAREESKARLKAALEESIRLKTEERAERSALLEEARQQPYNPDNPYGIFSWFDDRLRENGFGGATTEEALALRDILRFESQLESADVDTEARRQRDVALARFAIIEPILVSNELPNNQKAAAIDAALNQDGRPSLTEEEARMVYGHVVAEEVFGLGGRMAKQRQAILDSVMRDDSIPMKDKAREFNARLEATPELAGVPPTNEELAALSGTTELEAQIPAATEQTPRATGAIDADTATTPDIEAPVAGRVESSIPTPSGRPAAQPQTAEQLELPLRGGVDAGSVDTGVDTGRVAVPQPALTEEAASEVKESAPKLEVGGGRSTDPDYVAGKRAAAKKARDKAEEEGDTKGLASKMLAGVSTAEIPLVDIPVEKLRRLQGVNNEQPAPGQTKYDALRKSVDEEGWQPEKATGVRVYVNHNGEAFLDEGNNRVAVAAEEGIESLPVRVVYRNGAQDVKGPFSPANLIQPVPAAEAQVAPATEEAAPEVAPEPTPAPEPEKLSVKSVKQRRTVDEGTYYEVELSDGRVARIFRDTDQFGSSNPVWYIEPESVGVERSDLSAMGMPDMLGTTKQEALEALPGWVESNAPATRRTPPAPIESSAPATRRAPPAPEEAAPATEEVPQALEVQEEAVHSKLNEGEKKRLAKHYGRKTYDEVAKRQFMRDFSDAVVNGINTVAKAIRGIVRRIQKSVLAGAIVFSPAALTTDTPANFAVNLEVAQPSAEFAVTNQKFIPVEILAIMSPAAQATYEALAPTAVASNRPFMIADKPNGRLLIFGKDGVFQQETVAIYGRDTGDTLSAQRLAAQSYEDLGQGQRVTPSGVFTFAVVDNPTYPGQKVLALRSPEKIRSVGIGERVTGGVFVGLHGNTVTNRQRAEALRSGDASLAKQSMGCIVTSPEFFAENIAPNVDEFADAVIAIVPDEQTNLDAVLAASTSGAFNPSLSERLISRAVSAMESMGAPETAPTQEAEPELALGVAGAMGAMGMGQQGQRGAPEQAGRREDELPAEPSLESRMPDNPNVSKPQMVGAIADIIDWASSKKSKVIRKLNYKYQDAVDYAQALARSYGVSVESLPSNMALDRRFELFESRKTGNQMELQRRFLRPIIDLMKELDVNPDDVGLFLWARSAADRNAMIRGRNATMPDGGSGLTDAEAEAILQYLAESQNGELMPKLVRIAKLHDKLVRHMLDLRVDSGLLTRQQADAALELQPFYTPLKGYATEGDMQLLGEAELDGFGRYKEDVERDGDKKLKGALRQLGTRKSEFFQTEGRTTIPLNPLFNLFADAQQVVMYAEKNRVGQTFLDNILDDPEGHANIARVYTDLDSKTMIKPSRDPAYPDGTPVNANIQREVMQGNALVVKKDGVPYYVEFAPTNAGDALKRAFSNMTPAQLNKYFQRIQNTATGLKSMLTRYNPIYLYGTAYLRDTQDAILTAYVAQNMKGGAAEGKKIAEAMLKYLSPQIGKRRVPFTEKYVSSPAVSPLTGAIKNFISGRPPQTPDEARFMTALQEMIEEGGAVGHAMIASAETIAEEAKAELQSYANRRRGGARAVASGANNLRKGMAKALDATAQTIDLNARLATYLAAIENNLSKEDAARLALDSSLNLTRRGEWAGVLDTAFFFSSPTIESARKLARMSVKGGAKYLKRVFYLGVLSAIWNNLLGGGDDDDDGRTNYQQVPSYIKQTRLVMFYGTGANDYVAIPMGFLLALPKYLGEVTTETALGVIKSPDEAAILMSDALGKTAAGAFNAASPIRGEVEDVPTAAQALVPSVAKPLTDVFVFNRNYFNSPIYRSQSEFDNRVRSSLGKPGTPEEYKKLASFMNELTFGSKYASGVVDVQPEIYRYLITQYTGGLGRISDQVLFKGIDPEKPLHRQIPVLNSFVGKGSEYGPMNDYYELTGKGTPFEGTPAMEVVYRNYRGENSTAETAIDILDAHYADAPHLFDEQLLDNYKLTEDRLDDIYKERKAALESTDDSDEKRRIRNRYMEEAAREQARFNRLYRIIEKRYR